MMQPILLSTPSNSQANERLSDTTAIDKQAANDELLQEEEKSPGNFFDLLASAIMGTEKKKDGVVEEKGVEVNELAEQLVPALNSDGETVTADKELASTSIEQDSQKVEISEDEELLLENSMPEQPDFVPPPVENAPLLEPAPLANSAVETGQLNSSAAVKETAQPSIIAQIESAQKMDTQLSAPQKNASLSNASPMSPDSLKKGQEANSAAFDRSNLSSEKTAPKSVDNKLKNNLIKSLKSVSENTVKNTSDGNSLITDDNQYTPEAVTLDSSTKELDKSQQAVPVTPFEPLLQGESAASLAAEDNKPQQAVQDSPLMAGENRSIQGAQVAPATTG
ncbi:MAG: hypothetical protein OQK77_12770, partial [Psychromonas sp.]|nr:hypothetical protein [Psychromonas sp.]